MKNIEGILTADKNKIFKSKYGFFKLVCLGTSTRTVNGIDESFDIALNDISEVYCVNIDGKDFPLESTTYEDLVSELIRLKYSLNAELALYANSRLNPDSQEEKDFQEYRAYCKKLAKLILNE